MQTHRSTGWRCGCRGRLHGLCRMPPAPHVMAALFMEYKRKAAPGASFADYLASVGFVDPSVDTSGMDDRFLARPTAAGGVELLSVPRQKVSGRLRVIVLLVDFEDRKGVREASHYEDLLFSREAYPTGSMRDFFAEASNGKVEVHGSVHGWLRMPQKYAWYVNGESGTGADSYPRNSQRLAEDAVQAARWHGVAFPADLDKLGQGTVTALFIVHAGRGAEGMQSVPQQEAEIWSHKWTMQQSVEVATGLSATTYLVVPQDCRIGVCAHELGHLAFQWQDFYDPNYDNDGEYWDGCGTWDLMAGGAHNDGGSTPAHPAALHKVQHDWLSLQTVKASARIQVKPMGMPGARAVRIQSPAFSADQFLLLENRRRVGFDGHLAGEGLLVWKVDLSREMEAPARPGMVLVQADGFDELGSGHDSNAGDDGDPFPGSSGRRELGDTGVTSTSFPGGPRSGIRLSSIHLDAEGVVTLDVRIGGVAIRTAPAARKAAPAKARGKPKIKVVTDERLTLPGLLGKKSPAAAKKKPRAKTGKRAPARP